MTFNLRVRNLIDGANCFDFRREKILSVIRKEAPDVIGFQEATDTMMEWLKASLDEYYVLGHGRGKDYHGEGIPIAYRKDLFDLHGFRQEWMSFTPNKPASVFTGLDQSGCPRVFVCAELVHRESKVPFAFFNVHTDHRGEQARVAECIVLARELAASPFRFVVTGDFNAYPDSTSIQMLLLNADTLGIVDATKKIKGSFHGFKGDVGDRKIDYIFTNLPTNPSASYAIPDDDREGCYYSDHHALCSYIEIE